MTYMESTVLQDVAQETPDIHPAKLSGSKRARVATTVQYSAERALNARRVYSAMTRSRQRIVTASLLIIIAITAAFGLLLVNQARLVEVNYENARLEAQIRRAAIENTQLQEKIVRRTDLAGIEEAALDLGLQPVANGQVIPEARPVQDRMIIGQASANARLASDDAEGLYLTPSMEQVEEWYKQLLEEELAAEAVEEDSAHPVD